MGRAANFSGFSFTDAPFRMLGTDAFSGPEREIIAKELARADNQVAVFRRFRSRIINLNGLIVDSSSDAVDLDQDNLKLKTLFAGRGSLNIAYAGGYRRWGAEVMNCFITRNAEDVSRAAYSIQFSCDKAYATDGTTGTLINTTITANGPFSVVVAGTFMALPQIVLTVNSVTATGPVDIIIGNPSSGEYITVPQRNLVAGDTISIDCDNELVFHNSTLVAASGYFPGWAPGNGSLEFSCSASSFSIGTLGTYEKRYL
jgi:hypothetical protein